MTEQQKRRLSRGRLKEDGSGPIVCSVCTFVNPSNNVICDVCSAQLEVTDAIICNACTFRNSSSALVCEMCRVELADSEEMIAKCIDEQDDRRDSSDPESDLCDGELGVLMQDIYDEEAVREEVLARRKKQEIVSMRKTVTGKAWCLIDAVIELDSRFDDDVATIRRNNLDLGPIAVDDMIMFAEKLIDLQSVFHSQGRSTKVTVAYHYTSERSVEGIRQNGLMSGPEREANNIHAFKATGAYYGPGIYMANNPFAFQHFGDVGVIAAVLTGKTERITRYLGTPSDANTFIGNKSENKGTPFSFEDEIILKESAQCLPLIGFSTALIEGLEHARLATPASRLIWTYHQLLQFLLDDILNEGDETLPEMVLPDSGTVLPRIRRLSSAKRGPSSRDLLNPSVSVSNHSQPEDPPMVGTFSYNAPDTLNTEWDQSVVNAVAAMPCERCSVCHMALASSVTELSKCGHCFHEQCLQEAIEHQPNCPICRAPVVEPQGKSPSGTMIVSVVDCHCHGFDSFGTIIIEYSIASGVQKSYHPSPGTSFEGTDREAHLPNNPDGRKLVKRLIYAFQHGLTFSVGTSLTTGHDNTTVWGRVHHKTSFYGGEHSFPDPNYFFKCNVELDALSVPPSADCVLH